MKVNKQTFRRWGIRLGSVNININGLPREQAYLNSSLQLSDCWYSFDKNTIKTAESLVGFLYAGSWYMWATV